MSINPYVTANDDRPTTEQNRERLQAYFRARRVYRKALGQTDFPDPLEPLWSTKKDKGKAKPRQLKPCGTIAAYERHRKYDEPICADCQKAKFEYDQSRRTPKPPREIPCPSAAGYQMHRRRGETPCEGCRAAHSKANKESRQRRFSNQKMVVR